MASLGRGVTVQDLKEFEEVRLGRTSLEKREPPSPLRDYGAQASEGSLKRCAGLASEANPGHWERS